MKKLSVSIQNILANRGYSRDFIDNFYKPIDTSFPKFMYFKECYNMLINAVLQDKKICVFYDVDVDGLVAGFIMREFVSSIGGNVSAYINSTKIHGIHTDLIEYCKSNSIGLLIAVDSSSNSSEEISQLNSNNTSVIVLDHHIIESYTDTRPRDNFVIANCLMQEEDEDRDFTKVSGACVCYYFAQYCNKILGRTPTYTYLDLASITILSDFCSLENSVNRSLVYNLLNSTKLSTKITDFIYEEKGLLTQSDLTFGMFPAYNAVIRTGHCIDAVKMINAPNNTASKLYSKFYKDCINKQHEIINQLLAEVEVLQLPSFCLLNISDIDLGQYNNVKSGFCGLLASRILHRYNKAVFVLYYKSDEGLLKGSFRGSGLLNYKDIVAKSGITALGHKNAFGVILEPTQLQSSAEILTKTLPLYHMSEYDIVLQARKAIFKSKELQQYAEFNELAGSGLEKIKIKIESQNKIVEQKLTDRFSIINVDGLEIQCYSPELLKPDLGKSIVVTPVLKRNVSAKSFILVYNE